MECDDDGFTRIEAAAVNEKLTVKRRRYAAESKLQLDFATAVPFASDRKPVLFSTFPALENNYCPITSFNSPFMNNMDEISYWVHTKRAPCLYSLDTISNKQNEQAHCSKLKPKNNVKKVPSAKKRNKRKLVLLDDDSVSTEREHSAYFFTSDDKRRQTTKRNGKASSHGSDIDFNIKKPSMETKPKRMRMQRNSKLNHGKEQIVTSTPKVTALRRSLRKKCINNSDPLDSSFETMNKTFTIGNLPSPNIALEKNIIKKSEYNINTDSKNGDQVMDQNSDNINKTSKNEAHLNGQFDDVSDVSGFTANYIRSTKIHATRTPRNMRNKLNRNYIKESQESLSKEESKIVMFVNKSMNTGLPDAAALNCSTDSSQNVLNLVTLKTNEKSTRVSRATSLLKFMDPKHSDSKESLSNNDIKQCSNVSITPNGRSRYPRRQKNHVVENAAKVNSPRTPGRRKRICKNSSEFNNSDRKENPEEELISRTRSGRKIGLKVRKPENSVLVLSNSTEQLSSNAALNVASPTENQSIDGSPKKIQPADRCAQVKKLVNKSGQSLKRDSLRDKSGFAACFSESDNESELIEQRKFFR